MYQTTTADKILDSIIRQCHARRDGIRGRVVCVNVRQPRDWAAWAIADAARFPSLAPTESR